MSKLNELYDSCGQSPWLDNLKREWLVGGEVQQWVDNGIRGITSNPSIFQKAIDGGDAYDEQFFGLISSDVSVRDAYWELVKSDIRSALNILAPVHTDSGGVDGYVSVEVDPALAHDTDATIAAARQLDEDISEPNLMVKIPATKAGLPAIKTMISEGRSINVTLIFSLERYQAVIDSYIEGLENREGDLSSISSVASFFISRVDTEVDSRLDAIGSPGALELRGKAAVTQGQLAYEIFEKNFSGPRWDALATRGAKVQRPLWASTSTKNPDYPPTLYVDTLIGPNTVNTLPDPTVEAFEESGTVKRAVDVDYADAHKTWDAIASLVDIASVAEKLESEGVVSFQKAFEELIESLSKKANSAQ